MLDEFITDISSFPVRLRNEVQHLNSEQLNIPYRPGGWTIRQLVHHCADSHMNSLMRFKLALTEDQPVIKPYFEDRWAELPDSKMEIEPALQILEGLHARWTTLLKSLTAEQLKKVFVHPEHGTEISLEENIALYAWHCNHHLAHVVSLKPKKE
ncbi:putative metal-dependent hydrolase [Marivirga lumbricoides]|uniref:Metal-dependent hydrolase n=2 Tax=Marivirga lumbricoides TaxID=1046115 RepID=A0ABQ1MW39_9BACT|nr:putative metal-dependent hydrolase [Marivirga lumbricoides]